MSDSTVVNGTTPDTFLLPTNCDQYQWCLDWYGYVNYLPSIPGNAFFLAVFTIGLIAQLFLGIRHRAWSFTGPMLVGIILEIVGYGGRIGMHQNVFLNSWFIMYLCCLTIAPALFSAAVYLSLSRIITIFGPTLSLLRPRTITIMFIAFDFISLLLQAIGGALASTADTHASRDIGVHIMVAGLSTQVAATTSFAVLCLHLAWRIRKNPEKLATDTDLVQFRHTRVFRLFLGAIAVAVLTILIRCAFRVAELSEGFNSDLANDETLFMIFDSAMMVICVGALTAMHPGWSLGGRWRLGGVHMRKGKHGRGGLQVAEGGISETGEIEREKHAGATAVGSSSGTSSESGASRV